MKPFTGQEASALGFLARFPDDKERLSIINKMGKQAQTVAFVLCGLKEISPETQEVVTNLKKWANQQQK